MIVLAVLFVVLILAVLLRMVVERKCPACRLRMSRRATVCPHCHTSVSR